MNAIHTQIAGIVAIITAAIGNLSGGAQDTIASLQSQLTGSSHNVSASGAGTAGAGTLGAPTAAAPLANDQVTASSVYRAVNDYRARYGLAPVASNPQLNIIAQSWADHMAHSGIPAHNPNYLGQYPDGWHEGGENVHQNWRGASTEEVIQAWHNSPSHRINQADPNFNQIGVGVAYSNDGRMWVVTDYMW